MGVCYSRNEIILNDIMTYINKGYTLTKKDNKVIRKLYSKALVKTFMTKNDKSSFENFNDICRKDIDIHPIHILMVSTKNSFPDSKEGKMMLSNIKTYMNMFDK